MAYGLEEVSRVSDAELVSRLECLARGDRVLEVKLLVHLGELYERKLYLERGYSSIIVYCMSELRMSGDEAYFRVRAAKVGRRFPLVLERLSAGDVHLSGIKLLAPYLTDENHEGLLDRAKGKTKKQVEKLIAEIDPQPDAPARLRRLPCHRAALELGVAVQAPMLVLPLTAAAPPAEAPADATAHATFALQSPPAKASTKALSPGRFKLEVTLGEEAHSKLEQLQELFRHRNPSGDLARIVERALCELLDREMKRRFAQTNAPKRRVAREPARSAPEASAQMQSASHESDRAGPNANAPQSFASASNRSGPDASCSGGGAEGDQCVGRQSSRYIPRAVLREVFARDAGQCAFVSADGRRCSARGFLEVDHVVPFARGGAATADNLRLACRAHNMFMAEQDYGREFMEKQLRAAGMR